MLLNKPFFARDLQALDCMIPVLFSHMHRSHSLLFIDGDHAFMYCIPNLDIFTSGSNNDPGAKSITSCHANALDHFELPGSTRKRDANVIGVYLISYKALAI